MRFSLLLFLVRTCSVASAVFAAEAFATEPVVRSLFDGKSLAGWEGNPAWWRVEEGAITGEIGAGATLAKNDFLYWQGEVADFELTAEFRLSGPPDANSGILFRCERLPDGLAKGYQADIDLGERYLGNIHEERGRSTLAARGVRLSIAPDGRRWTEKFGEPADYRTLGRAAPAWNHYRIVANNGSLRLHVNGKEISGGDNANYRKGYLALESEGAPVEFRNLRIKELPSTGANASNTAPLDPGWRAIFNSVDLRGWRTSVATAARWSVVGEKLVLKAEPADQGTSGAALVTEAEFGDAEFIVDFQLPKAAVGAKGADAALTFRGATIDLAGTEGGKFSRFTITVRAGKIRVQRDAQPATELALAASAPARGSLGLVATGAGGTFMNLHARGL